MRRYLGTARSCRVPEKHRSIHSNDERGMGKMLEHQGCSILPWYLDIEQFEFEWDRYCVQPNSPGD